MVAVPMMGTGPYGTNPKSARSSTSNAKLDASEIETIFQQVNWSQDKVSATPANSPSRGGWFSRQFNKLQRRKSDWGVQTPI